MKIAVLDDYQNVVKDLEAFKLIKSHDVKIFNSSFKTNEDLVKAIIDFDAIVLIRERTIINEELLKKLPNLKVISQTGKVGSHIDMKACEKYNIKVVDGKGSPISTAELTFALILNSSRNINLYESNLKKSIWQNSSFLGLGESLYNKNLGIWGYGNIGKKVARFAKAFDMNVTIYGSENSIKNAINDGFNATNSKEEFFSNMDIITLHLKLNENTKECVSKNDLLLMNDNSILINTSRSALIQKDALFEVLSQNKTKKAAIDVFDTEPTDIDDEPLLKLDNVLATPHIGFVEKENYELYFKTAFENLINIKLTNEY